MKAAVFEARRVLAIMDVPDPRPGPKDVVVEVRACGICGTDLHLFEGEFLSPATSYPLIPGHEPAGVVAEVGGEVSSLRVGDRVAIDPSLFCGDCYFCRANMGNHCLRWNGVGNTVSGGFAEYVAVPARNAYLLGDLGFPEAAFVEPLACVVYGLRRLQARTGDDVLVIGAGPIGLLLLQALARGGAARVVVTDTRTERLSIAGTLGAYRTVPADADRDGALRELAPLGFDVVVDATGSPAAVEAGLPFAKPGGKVLLFGVCPPGARVALRPFEIFRKDLTILGSFALCYTFNPALNLLQSGAVDVRPLLTHRFPLDQFAAALATAQAGSDSLKVQVQPRKGGP